MRREPLEGPFRSLLRLLAAAFLVVGTGSTTAGKTPASVQSIARQGRDLRRLEEWLGAVERHRPGERDGAALSVGSWSRAELEILLLDFRVLVQVIVQPDTKRLRIPRAGGELTSPELQRLRDLAEREVQQGGGLRQAMPAETAQARAKRAVNRLAKRGALLHTDIALLVQATADRFQDLPANGPTPSLPIRQGVLVRDGRQEGLSYGVVHWDVARSLLDNVMPAPSQDPAVRQWYRGVAAFFASKSRLVEAGPHLDRARQLFPAAPDILAASGALYEAEAAPAIQNFVQAPRPDGLVATIDSARSNWRRAEVFFRKAVDLDGTFAEARLHLGRVLGLRERHQEAADHLRQAAATADDSLTRYYSWLFLGVEEQALGHFDRARESFESAAALWPKAQSPRLALSQLARRAGDRSGALRALQQVMTLSTDEGERDDPWWTYFEDPSRQAEWLVAQLRATLFLSMEER